ncbi:Glycosyltransferase AglJ [uncultured archaeon]|nr:Glycosyltransferase AglJ [uncultured archaeon]
MPKPKSSPHPWLAKKSVSVILPVYAEDETIPLAVSGLKQALGPYLLETIAVVSPHSPPRTISICRSLARRDRSFHFEMQARNPGLGWAVRQGLAHARGDYVLMMDSDGEMDPRTARLMLQQLQHQPLDLIVASRWMQPRSLIGYGRLKYHINRSFQLFNRLLFGLSISDCSLGYKLLSRRFAQSAQWKGRRHEIALETTLRPILMGARYVQVPTRWTARTTGSSKNNWGGNFRYLGMSLRLLAERTMGRVKA